MHFPCAYITVFRNLRQRHPVTEFRYCFVMPDQFRKQVAAAISDPALSLAARLDRGIRADGRSVGEIAKASGMAYTSLKDVLSGRTKRPMRLSELASTLGVPYELLRDGKLPTGREPPLSVAEPLPSYGEGWTAPIGKKQAALVLAAQTMAGRLPDDVAEAITKMILVSAGAVHGTEDAPGTKAKP